MKKFGFIVLGIVIILVVVIVISVYFALKEKPGTDEVFLIPDGYKGCVGVFYDFKDEPPLKIQDNKITYRIPENGILKTSSPQDFGWSYEEHSGWHDVKYYYVDQDGNRVKELKSDESIFAEASGGGTGDVNENGEFIQYFHSSFFVGDDPQSDPMCFEASYEGELIELLEK
ncbi:DUF6843 domain-containing protein [Priestia abyssalis]|uniref:DUF6843 domain-containing protein n=1 Tax=Priestia abyssalis TaxID=1221450 RepID=UPI000995BA4B|nr:hypothetical protein [Priestia abyssalis]